MSDTFSDENGRLYDLINETAKDRLCVLEDTLEALPRAQSGKAMQEADVREALERMEQAGSAIRKEVTEFLTSDAVHGTDEDLVYDAKRHIHTDLGHVLMMTTAWLQGNASGDATARPDGQTASKAPLLSALVKEWTDVLNGIRTGTWKAAQTDAKKQLKDAAKAAGVSLVFTESLPDDEKELRMFIKNASAKIVAAVRAGNDAVTLP